MGNVGAQTEKTLQITQCGENTCIIMYDAPSIFFKWTDVTGKGDITCSQRLGLFGPVSALSQFGPSDQSVRGSLNPSGALSNAGVGQAPQDRTHEGMGAGCGTLW